MASLKDNCPCGSDKAYQQCCGLFIEQNQVAPTPEALMRSRYVAYTQARIDYIAATMMGPAAKNFDALEAKQWVEQVTWLNLKIIQALPTQSDQGFVEFIASYEIAGKQQSLHELSEFHRQADRWYYFDGKAVPTKKLGRNSPCHCGSGKKFKKCCGT